MINFQVFPKLILLYGKKDTCDIYYSIFSNTEDSGTLVAYNPFYAQCVSLDRENIFHLPRNKKLQGKISLDMTKGPPFTEAVITFEVRTVNSRVCSKQHPVCIRRILQP